MRGGCFSVRLALLAAIGTIALIVYGGNGVYEGLKYRKPVEITYQQFLQQKPKEGWYRITGGVLYVPGAGYVYEEKHKVDPNEVNKLYVPMHSPETMATEQDPEIHMFVLSGNPDVVNAFKDLQSQDSNASEEKIRKYMEQNIDKFLITRPVEGKIKSGLSSEDSETTKALEKGSKLASDYVILEEGAKPSPGIGAVMLVGGLLLAVGQVVFYITRFANR